MHVGMTFALFTAARAGLSAGLEQRTHQLLVACDLPRKRGTRRCANIGTDPVQSDTAGELGQHLLRQAGVGTRGARLCAIEAGVDAAS